MDPVANNRFRKRWRIRCMPVCSPRGFVITNAPWHQRHLAVDTLGLPFYPLHSCLRLSDDQGLIELLSPIWLLSAKPSISRKLPFCLTAGITRTSSNCKKKLYKLWPGQVWTHTKPTKAEENSPRSIWICPVATRWVIERSNAWMERCKFSQIWETLNHATKLNLFIRLMLKG